MNNEKLENLLNLALDATPEEREKSLELNVGYDTASRSWEVIVKASGDFDTLLELFPQITVKPLLNGYGILTVPAALLDALSERPEIEYMEKPKRLIFCCQHRPICLLYHTTSDGTHGKRPNTKQSLRFRYHHCHHRLRH